MRSFFLTASFFLFTTNLFAQSKEVITVSGKESPSLILSMNGLYRYPQFTNGKVFFKDGTAAAGKLNYNLLLQEIMFLDPKGDTLAVDNKQTIKYVSIGKDSLYYFNGFVEILPGKYPKLAIKNFIKLADRQKIGAYNIPSSTVDMKSYKAYQTARPNDKIVIDENTVFIKGVELFVVDSGLNFFPANEKGLARIYSVSPTSIKKILKDEGLNIEKEEDLRRLMAILDSSN